MIHYRGRFQIAPGRQAECLARMHEWVAIWKEAAGVDVGVSVIVTGTLGWECYSADFVSMGAFEAAEIKCYGSPKGAALMATVQQEHRDGNWKWVPGTMHDEFWRDA